MCAYVQWIGTNFVKSEQTRTLQQDGPGEGWDSRSQPRPVKRVWSGWKAGCFALEQGVWTVLGQRAGSLSREWGLGSGQKQTGSILDKADDWRRKRAGQSLRESWTELAGWLRTIWQRASVLRLMWLLKWDGSGDSYQGEVWIDWWVRNKKYYLRNIDLFQWYIIGINKGTVF